jgi:hypothetical protein
VDFFDADSLSGKDLAEIDFLVTQTDAAATSDHDGFVVEGIVDVGQSGVGTRGRLVDLGRAFHVQSFMRTLAIKNFHEVIEAGLLLQEVLSGRLGGFFLQGEMLCVHDGHSVGDGGLDSFDADAQAQLPDGELTEMKQSVRGSKGPLSLRMLAGRPRS